MSEEVFKNVQILKGIPVDEFMDTMGMFAAALSLNCVDCHTPESVGSWDQFADETALKRTARRMMLMVNTINKDNFGGVRVLTCYTCHRGDLRPRQCRILRRSTRRLWKIRMKSKSIPFPGGLPPIRCLTSTSRRSAARSGWPPSPALPARGRSSGVPRPNRRRSRWKYLAKAPCQRSIIVHAHRRQRQGRCDGRSGPDCGARQTAAVGCR